MPKADLSPPVDSIDRKKLDVAFVGGIAWTAGAKWFTQVLSWASLLIIARLLSPSDFGTVAPTTVYFGLMNVLAEFGIGTAVVNMRELQRHALAQLNTVCLLLGVAAFGFSAAVAPLVAAFFRSPKLEPVVIVTSIGFFMTALRVVQMGVLQRDMNYKLLSLAEGLQSVVQALTTLVCAFLGLGYWSLVAGGLCGTAAAAVVAMVWVRAPYAKPRLRDIGAALRFGSHMVTARVAWYGYTQSDIIVGGRVLAVSALGAYTFALNLASMPGEKITAVIMRVTGPLFARIQQDPAAMRRYLVATTESLSFLTFPAVLGLAAVAEEFVAVALGKQWGGVAAPLRWLAFYTGLRTIATLMPQVLTALRQTAFTMRVYLATLVVMPFAFYAGSHWGPTGLGAAWTFAYPIMVMPMYVRVFRSIDLSAKEYLNAIAPPLVASLAMLGAVLAVAHALPGNWPHLTRLLIEVAVGAVVYAAVLMVAFRKRVLRYRELLRSFRRSR
ncbi:MAG: lipopolysaccharide biosynthesis protein [Bryobacteraceae bacterium]|nr:lipopolysaccharide biosynthesis protein [Bryobacteraceae bacterium]